MHNRQGRRALCLWLTGVIWVMGACAPAVSPAPLTATPFASSPSPLPSGTPVPPTPTGAAQLTPTPDCLLRGGQVIPFSLPSAVIGKPLTGYLYLPPCFEPHAGQPYPLLILLHGQSATAEQWLRVGAAETADRLIAERVIPPLVIALPYEEYSLRNPFESGYDRALLDEFLPWLAGQYPGVCAERPCRALGGLSRGGGMALLIGFAHSGMFRAIGGHSAPPFYGMESRLPLWVKETSAESLPAVYLDVGEEDRYYRSIEELHTLLERLGVPHEWQVNPGAHDEDYWRSQVENYLRWYGNLITLPAKITGTPE